MDRLSTTILYRTYARFQNDAHRKDQLPQLKQKGREGNGDVRNGRGKGVWLRCHTFSELNILFSSKIKCTLLSWWQLFFHSSSRQLDSCLTNTIQCSYGQGHKEIHSLTTIKISWREILHKVNCYSLYTVTFS